MPRTARMIYQTMKLNRSSLARRSGVPFAGRSVLVLLLVAAAGASGAAEIDLITEALALEPGSAVADVGAGDGKWAFQLAEVVGSEGRVWATEVDEELVEKIRRRAEDEEMTQVTAVLGDQEAIGLPAGCCDAVLLRMVYHHFEDPVVMRAELRRALRPGGLLAIVDIRPQRHWRDLDGVPDRGGHGISAAELSAEMEAAGFTAVGEFEEWPGEEDKYCVVFQR